ncbi:C-factor, partial [Balearica regulorum gibbericeps]
SDMGELHIRSVLVTGANRGIGLGLVQHFLGMPNPPKWVFAAWQAEQGAGHEEAVQGGSQSLSLCAAPPASPLVGCGTVRGGRMFTVLVPNVARRVRSWSSLLCYLHAHPYLLSSPLLRSQAFLPLLKKAAQGSPGSALSCSKAAIVNMSSSAGSIEDVYLWHFGHVVSYRCSKAALNMLTKCQSLGYREHGVLCVALHPGWVQTDMGGSGSQKPPVTVDESVRGMLKVLSSLSEKETGTFLDWEGKVVPW